MPRKSKETTSKPVEALRHTDSRVNIPTSELRDFAGDAELTPPTIRYPRDTSLDPQLVWNGKDEQDGDDLKVLAVPIYIQEKIQPQAIIEEVRKQAASSDPEPQQMSLFSDFNGIDFEQLIEFYQHEQHWTNRMILGDSLLVMNSLAQKEGLKGQVQMIYLDPPYGIKFGSNWQVSTRKRDVKDGREEDLVRQPEQIRAFRDTWEKGIHSYLSYLRDRLMVARELLTESGSIFVQIGDENVHLVRSLLDEVFGKDNFISLIQFVKTSLQATDYIANTCDFLIWYGKVRDATKVRKLYFDKPSDMLDSFRWVDVDDVVTRISDQIASEGDNIRRFRSDNITSQGTTSEGSSPFSFQGKVFSLSGNKHWKTHRDGLVRLNRANRIVAIGNTLAYKRYVSDFTISSFNNMWADTLQSTFATQNIYVVQTNTKVIERCLLMTTDPGDLVLDPTMGSGTTAYVAEHWGRRWITIDTSRVALALARTRLMSARYPYYLLADSADGLRKQAELSGRKPGTGLLGRAYAGDVKQGFVYETVPHITLRDIANNEEIDRIHERWQPYLEERRAWLNQTLGTVWEEWEVPRELPANAPAEVEKVLTEYWQARRERQQQMDESIQRNSERETLYDRPYEDKRKVRVAGPFTVESLSPHRILDPGYTESAARQATLNSSYEQMVIDNLRIAGVQNTRRDERLTFDTLEPFPGVWLQAQGSYTDEQGEERRVAVAVGSEHGTVTARQIKEAVKEAVKGIGFDLLLVCGFAFDAHASEESKRYGDRLNVQIVRMNPDLMMGSVLKQTDRANLFTIFGEPDITVDTLSEDRLQVTIQGLDIYDPTRGTIRSSSVDDIACWFIDTAYNDESFFVRQAYFLGKEDAYDQLKKALRAEIDESAWSMLYSNQSVPFARPESGRIAIKVINHYGDEVLKVYTV